MGTLDSTQLRKGVVFKHQGNVYMVLDYKHVKKGRGLANVRVKVRDVESRATVEKTFTSNERVESVDIIQKSAQYMYSDDENFHFMDSKDFSQFGVRKELINWESKFLTEGLKVNILWLDDKVVSLELPKKVGLKVKYTEPGVVGDTTCGATKEAVLESGYKLQVPLFVKIGDVVKVNTESGKYVSKA